jgi:hypothetical protein
VRWSGDYDDLAVDVDESDFFFVEPDDVESDFFASDLVSVFFDDESGDELSEVEDESADESDLVELPFGRLEPFRLSFL